MNILGEGQAQRRKRGCLFYVRRGLLYLLMGILLMAGAGVVYQTAASNHDRSNYQPRGDIINVDGYNMHLHCTGAGEPTVILESGGLSFSLEWYWVQDQLATTNRVCSYDRAGTGWSDFRPEARTAVQIVTELHALLQAADVPGPYLLAGHSFGAILNRVYAAKYPDEVLGIVMADTGFVLPTTFADEAAYLQWKRENDILQVLVWAMMRTGVYRLTAPDQIHAAGYPPEIAAEYAALRADNRMFDTYYAETILARLELAEASQQASDLGQLPLFILWADYTSLPDEQKRILAAHQQTVETFSSNVTSIVVSGSDHGSIIGSEMYAQHVTDAIRQTMFAAQSGNS